MSRHPTTGIRYPIAPRVADAEVDRALRDHHRTIVEILGLPIAGARVLEAVELADATTVPVAHGLGRAPRFVVVSAARPLTSGVTLTGGAVNEIRDGSVDRTRAVLLRATGYGATAVVDVLVL